MRVTPEVGTQTDVFHTVDAATAVLFVMTAQGLNPQGGLGSAGFAGGYSVVIRYRVTAGKAGGYVYYAGGFEFDGLGTYAILPGVGTLDVLSSRIDPACGTPALSLAVGGGGVQVVATGTLGKLIDHIAWVSVMGPPVP